MTITWTEKLKDLGRFKGGTIKMQLRGNGFQEIIGTITTIELSKNVLKVLLTNGSHYEISLEGFVPAVSPTRIFADQGDHSSCSEFFCMVVKSPEPKSTANG